MEDFTIPKIESSGKKYCKYCRQILSETKEEFHEECKKEVDNHGVEYPSEKDAIVLNDLQFQSDFEFPIPIVKNFENEKIGCIVEDGRITGLSLINWHIEFPESNHESARLKGRKNEHYYNFEEIGKKLVCANCSLSIIRYLDKLEYLNLSNNNIEDFDLFLYYIRDLEDLETLIINNNKLIISKSFDPKNYNLYSLKKMHIDGNKAFLLEKNYNFLSNKIDDFSADKVIIYKRNDEFDHLQDLLMILKEEKEVRLPFNDYMMDDHLFSRGFLVDYYTNPRTIIGINLANLGLSQKDDQIISKIKTFSNLEIIGFSENEFTEFPYTFSNFHPKLWMIKFTLNRLTKLPDWLLKLEKLDTLEVYGNNIEVDPSVIKKYDDRDIGLMLEYEL
ncbi:MAG: hypothetical protein HeimC3_20440 [Candidatus Heimdallarchaeota archaeon LC_3]|nr:MAG: hypothetical protein HeimC3_20440 [Candidatus Heimdallarchaeota archaeon LC_3]